MAARRITIVLSTFGVCLILAAAASAAPPVGAPAANAKKTSAPQAKAQSPKSATTAQQAGASKPATSPISRTVARPAPITPEPRHVPLLIRKLGDRSYATREAATRALVQIGVPGKDELINALKDPDAEIRYRAKLVLSEVLQLDWRNRLEAFVADTKGEREHQLPGWDRYRKMVGDNITARRLFADMQRQEPGLLEASEVSAKFAGDAVASRCQQIQDARRMPGRSTDRQIPLGAIATLLFVSSDEGVPITTQTAASLTNFCYEPDFGKSIAGGDPTPIKKILGDWISRGFGKDSTAMHQTMMLALKFNIPEGIVPALGILKDGGANPHMRQYAILVVGRFGGPEHIAQLEPLLSDAAVCIQQQITANKGFAIETQIRDVALAVMVHLAKQKLPDFGFTRAQGNATVLYNTASLGFATPEDRDAALSKWRAWREQQALVPKR